MAADRNRVDSEEQALARGLAGAGLERAEIDAFLAYSREIELELGPVPQHVRSRRLVKLVPWVAFAAAAALLLAAGAWAFSLAGERGALERELAQVRGERDALAVEMRATTVQRSRLDADLAVARRELDRRRADDATVQSEFVRDLLGRLGEHAAMGDPRALPTARFLSDVAHDRSARPKFTDYRDAWSPLEDPFGFSPKGYDFPSFTAPIALVR